MPESTQCLKVSDKKYLLVIFSYRSQCKTKKLLGGAHNDWNLNSLNIPIKDIPC